MEPDETPREDDLIFEDDPELGRFIAYHPVRRLWLVAGSALILLAIWFVITVALWQVENTIAATVTVAVITVAALTLGWAMLHVWNREVVLYEKGFSYRRGSQAVYLPYDQVDAIRQAGERVTYFGGLVRRTNYTFQVITRSGEVIILNVLYQNLDMLTRRLETAATAVLFERAQAALERGESVDFGAGCLLKSDAVMCGATRLKWVDYQGFTIRQGALLLHDSAGNVQAQLPLRELNNVRLLVELLRHHTGDRAGDPASPPTAQAPFLPPGSSSFTEGDT
ncbi:MAG: DUF6585 family protein [Chloroflexota bacterium]